MSTYSPEELAAEINKTKERLELLYEQRKEMVLAAFDKGISVVTISRRLNMRQPNVSSIIKGRQ